MLHETIHTQMVEAMKAKDTLRLSVLRGLITACTQELLATKRTPRDTLSDEEVLAVIRRSIKQRRDSAEQFTKGGRTELAEKELAEASVLEAYLPQGLSREETEAIIANTKAELAINDKKDMGKLMGAVMRACAGRGDGVLVKELVEKSFE